MSQVKHVAGSLAMYLLLAIVTGIIQAAILVLLEVSSIKTSLASVTSQGAFIILAALVVTFVLFILFGKKYRVWCSTLPLSTVLSYILVDSQLDTRFSPVSRIIEGDTRSFALFGLVVVFVLVLCASLRD